MRYTDVLDETLEKFNKVLETTSIPHWVEFKLLADFQQKELYQVRKANELLELLSDGINVVIIINEQIYDDLTDEMKTIMFEEALTGIVVDIEKGKVSIEKYDITTYSGMLVKHGSDTMILFMESVKSLFDAKEEKEKAEKEAKKQRKKKQV
ncbi:MAG: hypothetical protein ACOCVF_01365 [bacterium]